ncbi:MAG: YkgJ family cysteine cluster protein [Wenzhouxiangella sp.]|jgi:Fe-S-cluster containining protein|nr:YkgJ family cysteine cluster protein [Wenzhouxiangella sp.]
MTASPRHESIRIRVTETSLNSARREAATAPQRSLRQVQRLIERETRTLPRADRLALACRAGCDFCCHLRVMATPIEVFALLDYLARSLSEQDLASLTERIRETDRRLRAIEPEQILTTNIPCPVLVDGTCSAYPGRPLNCRSYHSLSRAACEASFENPTDLSLGHPQLTGLAKIHEGAQAGLFAAFDQAGRDRRQYELVTAMAEALEDPGCRERFERGEPAFRRPLTIPGA